MHLTSRQENVSGQRRNISNPGRSFLVPETDLHAVIRANILEEIHKQYTMYQLFRCLKYMHTAELLHRDIKVSDLVSSMFLHGQLFLEEAQTGFDNRVFLK